MRLRPGPGWRGSWPTPSSGDPMMPAAAGRTRSTTCYVAWRQQPAGSSRSRRYGAPAHAGDDLDLRDQRGRSEAEIAGAAAGALGAENHVVQVGLPSVVVPLT
jgi:hypothetical protein